MAIELSEKKEIEVFTEIKTIESKKVEYDSLWLRYLTIDSPNTESAKCVATLIPYNSKTKELAESSLTNNVSVVIDNAFKEENFTEKVQIAMGALFEAISEAGKNQGKI